MFFQSDTVMRMIESLQQILRKLLGLTDEQRAEQAEELLRDALRRMAGIDMSACRALPAERVFFLAGGDRSPDRVLAAARILEMQADIDEQGLLWEEAALLRASALELYLRLGPEGGGFVSDHVSLLMAKGVEARPLLAAKFWEAEGSYARAEDAMDEALASGECGAADLRAFYMRLLALPDDRLVAGGLPRDEVVEGMERLVD